MNMFSHFQWATSKSFHIKHGRRFDMEKPIDVVRYNIFGVIDWFAEAPRALRLSLADRLAWLASWLRGEPWYVADAWHGVPGNRAAELCQQARDEMIRVMDWNDEDDKEAFGRHERKLNELGRLAGESWGHVWPKTK